MGNPLKPWTEHEGQIVCCTICNGEASNGHKLQPRLETRRFRIENGRRIWLSIPPMAWMREEVKDQASNS